MNSCPSSNLDCTHESTGVLRTLCAAALLSASDCIFSPGYLWPADATAKASSYDDNYYDFIVVGAGAAGSIVASRLAENPDYNVLVVERGINPPDESQVIFTRFAILGTKYADNYLGRADHACQGFEGGCFASTSTCIGGNDGDKSISYLRGNDEDYNSWARNGLKTWGWDGSNGDALKYHKKAEDNLNPQIAQNSFYHSTSGKTPISLLNATSRLSSTLLDAALEMGWNRELDLNADKWTGYAFTQGAVAGGRRRPAARNYLTPASRRGNLDVIKGATCTEIIIKKKKAIGVRYIKNGSNRVYTIKCRKEVIVAAGSIRSPQLLQLSGIGPKALLKKLRIKVKADLPVGENLHDQVGTANFIAFPGTGENPDAVMQRDFKRFLNTNDGPFVGELTENLVALINTQKNSKSPDVRLQFVQVRAGTDDWANFFIYFKVKEPAKSYMLSFAPRNDVVSIVSHCAKPKSRGWVRARSRSMSDFPDINFNFLDELVDRDTLARSFRQQAEFMKTRAYRDMNATLILPPLPECDCFKDSDWDSYSKCYVERISFSFFDVVGSVKAGAKSDPTACLDYRLRVFGIENLRVVGGPIMPMIPSGGKSAPTLMIAEKAAAFIKEDWA